MIGISACLGGDRCRYDGKIKKVPALEKWANEGLAWKVCPEVLGGLATPRPAAEIIGGDGFNVWEGTATVRTQTGEDVTEAFKTGALTAYKQLKARNIDTVILKSKSPSCGSCWIYDGHFSGTLTEGIGVAAAYFMQQGIQVMTEEEWLQQQV